MLRLIALLLVGTPPGGPSGAPPADTLRLAPLRALAEAQDPRRVQPELLARASRLRIEALHASGRPQLALTGQATFQSDVPQIPITRPDGTTPAPPREQARAQVEADWAVLDGGRRAGREALERARLAEQTAGVAVTLYGLRDATTEAFFAALLAQARAQTLALTADDLAAQLALVRARAADGAALDADADAVEADLLGVRQQIAEAEGSRRAALAVLADLTGLEIGPDDVLALPDLDAAVARAVQLGAVVAPDEAADALATAARPEFARLARTQARAEAEARLAETATRPAVSLFGQAGVGRPSPFDFLSDTVKPYALAGVRIRWVPLDWGQAARTAAAARLDADVAQTEADALARTLVRQTRADRDDLARLDAAAADDARIVSLREEVLRGARTQRDEGVLLAPAYVDRLTDLAGARLAASRHRIERARAQARVLSALGFFPDTPPPSLPLDR